MKIVQTIFTRNEGDLLKQNIEFHHRLGVDFFLLTESSSTDNTRDIISHFKAKGIAECFYDEKIMAQKENMEKMVIIAREKYRADWIIISDTDEFWFTEGGLKGFLKNIPTDVNVLKVLRYQYFPTALDEELGRNIYQQMSYRETGKWLGFDTGVGDQVDNFARKKIILKPVTSNIDIMVGNHTVHFPDRMVLEINPSQLMIHEFPFRSYDQFKSKIERARQVFIKNQLFIKNKNYGTHWRYFLDLLEKDKLEDFYYNNIYFDIPRLNKYIQEGKITKDISLSRINSN